MTRTCKCGQTNPLKFYASTKANKCMDCYNETSKTRARNKVEMDKQEKLKREQCAKCLRKVSYETTHHFEWNHIDPSKKEDNVSKMLHTNIKQYPEEILKCELLCLFCHADVTKEQRKNKTIFPGRPRIYFKEEIQV